MKSPLLATLILATSALAQETAQPQSTTAPPPATLSKPTQPAISPLNRPSATHRAIQPTESLYRVIAVVPLVGNGKKNNPIRPDFVPLHGKGAAYRTGIISWTQIPADDGKHAIVEIVAQTRDALTPILTDKRPDVIAFEHGKSTKSQIETAFQSYKKNFTLDKFPRAVAK